MKKLNEFNINKSDTIYRHKSNTIWATGVGIAVAFPCENGTLVLQMANLSTETPKQRAQFIILKPWSWIWNPPEPKSTISIRKHNLLSMHKLLSNKTTKHRFLNHSKRIQQKLESMQIICCHHNRGRGKCWNLSQILEHMFRLYSLP